MGTGIAYIDCCTQRKKVEENEENCDKGVEVSPNNVAQGSAGEEKHGSDPQAKSGYETGITPKDVFSKRSNIENDVLMLY